MNTGKRYVEEFDDDNIDSAKWGFGSYEQLPAIMPIIQDIAKIISEGINNSDPCMQIEYSEDMEDIIVEFALGLAKNEWGPSWKFSLRNNITALDWPDDQTAALACIFLQFAGILLTDVAIELSDDTAIEHLRSAETVLKAVNIEMLKAAIEK